MAEEPQDEIVYRYTPPFEGAFLRGVPQRDLTQTDVDRMSGADRRDAFAPHPLHGTPLYTAVDGKPKQQQDRVIAAAEKAAERAEKDGNG